MCCAVYTRGRKARLQDRISRKRPRGEEPGSNRHPPDQRPKRMVAEDRRRRAPAGGGFRRSIQRAPAHLSFPALRSLRWATTASRSTSRNRRAHENYTCAQAARRSARKTRRIRSACDDAHSTAIAGFARPAQAVPRHKNRAQACGMCEGAASLRDELKKAKRRRRRPAARPDIGWGYQIRSDFCKPSDGEGFAAPACRHRKHQACSTADTGRINGGTLGPQRGLRHHRPGAGRGC